MGASRGAFFISLWTKYVLPSVFKTDLCTYYTSIGTIFVLKYAFKAESFVSANLSDESLAFEVFV